LPIGEAGEMQHRPEPVVAVREVMPVDGGAVRRVDAAKDHVKTVSEDVRRVPGHGIAEIFTALSSNTPVRPFQERPRVR
jgi:hypothetical protein